MYSILTHYLPLKVWYINGSHIYQIYKVINIIDMGPIYGVRFPVGVLYTWQFISQRNAQLGDKSVGLL